MHTHTRPIQMPGHLLIQFIIINSFIGAVDYKQHNIEHDNHTITVVGDGCIGKLPCHD